MPNRPSATEIAKYVSARRAVDLVEDGMRVGLGTGSTAAWMVRALGRRMRDEGLRIEGMPTSAQTAALAGSCGIPLIAPDDLTRLDLTIDGADEVDGGFSLIKGGGGALLQEKIVAAASDRMVVITDPSKRVAMLGSFPLPVEVIAFGWRATRAHLETFLAGADVDGRKIALRTEPDAPFRTDEGNLILDLHLGRIGDASALALGIAAIPGVVEHGLFLDICDAVIVGAADGTVELQRAGSTERERGEVDLSGIDALLEDGAA